MSDNLMDIARAWARYVVSSPKHVTEQARWRSSICRDCAQAGKCLVCGCYTPAKFFANSACAGGRYPSLMNKDQWDEYKKEHKIETKE